MSTLTIKASFKLGSENGGKSLGSGILSRPLQDNERIYVEGVYYRVVAVSPIENEGCVATVKVCEDSQKSLPDRVRDFLATLSDEWVLVKELVCDLCQKLDRYQHDIQLLTEKEERLSKITYLMDRKFIKTQQALRNVAVSKVTAEAIADKNSLFSERGPGLREAWWQGYMERLSGVDRRDASYYTAGNFCSTLIRDKLEYRYKGWDAADEDVKNMEIHDAPWITPVETI